MTRWWRHTGQVLPTGEHRTVEFELQMEIPDLTIVANRLDFIAGVRGIARLGATRGMAANFVNTKLIEVSDDEGATWRTVVDDRALYAGPPPRDGPPTPRSSG